MKLADFCSLMERIAPTSLAMQFDNVGLLIGPCKTEIRKVLVALDCSLAVAEEAIACNADLVLTHHPLFLHPVNRILPDAPETASAYRLIQNGIGLYAAHTNLDICDGGVNDALAAVLQLQNIRPMQAEIVGRMGETKREMTLAAFAEHCGTCLGTRVQVCGDLNRTVSLVGLVGGSAGDCAAAAKQHGCDVFVTGELKHHEALSAQVWDIPCIVGGHYYTEAVVRKPLITRLQKESFDVEYIESRTEQAPIVCFDGGK